jgi:hypothetical protein
VNSAFVKWFAEFDENKLRPWLIHNYTLQNVLMQDFQDDVVAKNLVNNEEVNLVPVEAQADASLLELFQGCHFDPNFLNRLTSQGARSSSDPKKEPALR